MLPTEWNLNLQAVERLGSSTSIMPGFIYISTTLRSQYKAQHWENTVAPGVGRKVETPKCEKQGWNHRTEIPKISKMETNADKKERGSRKFKNIHQYVEYPKERISHSPCADGFAQGRPACFGYKKKEITSILKTASNSLHIAWLRPLIHANNKTEIHLKFWLSKINSESALAKKMCCSPFHPAFSNRVISAH